MPKCWALYFENCAGVKGYGFRNATSVGTAPGSCGVVLVENGINTGIGEKTAVYIDVSNGFDISMIPPAYRTFYGGQCIPPDLTYYDCVNGACIPKTTYNTPGLYQSLGDCEVACGTGCSGKCISNSGWAQIEGLSDELESANCG